MANILRLDGVITHKPTRAEYAALISRAKANQARQRARLVKTLRRKNSAHLADVAEIATAGPVNDARLTADDLLAADVARAILAERAEARLQSQARRQRYS